jgi:hypothetical protein
MCVPQRRTMSCHSTDFPCRVENIWTIAGISGNLSQKAILPGGFLTIQILA